MSCKLCTVVNAVVLNLALLTDVTLNVFLGGNVRETVSKRTARAREHGSKPATVFCAFLTLCGRAFGQTRDHCTWALDGQAKTVAVELWHWSPADGSDDIGNG